MSASLTAAANTLTSEPRPPHQRLVAASMVVPELKLAYVTNHKAACSTVKWAIAQVTRQDPDHFYGSLGRRPTRAQTIHDRDRWAGVPRLQDYADVSEFTADNGWYVFTLLRDPRARLWSAWQSKLLVGNPNFLGKTPDQPWYPRVPRQPSDVIEDFARFVEVLSARREKLRRVGKDGHFRPQSDLVYREGLRYSHVYDLKEIPAFERDLAAHLAAMGHDAMPQLRNDNDTPLKLTAEVLANGVGEAIEEIYREDFDRFGEAWVDGPRLSTQEWSPAAFVDIGFRREAHRRIRDLSDAARALAEENARLTGSTAPEAAEVEEG